MSCRWSGRRGAAPCPAPPRSLLAQLARLCAGGGDPRPAGPRCGAARPGRDAQDRRCGDVNDGDSITLGGERIRLRGIDAPEYDQICRKDGATIPAAAARARRWPRLIGGRRGRLQRLGARPLRPPARRSARPAASISTGGRWRTAGRSPMATTRRRGRPRAKRGAGLWAGSFERPRDWRDRAWRHGRERARSRSARIAQLAAADLRLFMTAGHAVVIVDGRIAMKLFDGGRAPNPRRVRIFLAEKGIAVPLVPVDMGALEHKQEAISSRNPLQRLPVLELDDGTILTEIGRDLPLFRGAASRAGAVRHAARSARRRSRCGSAAWSSTCSAAVARPSATSTPR